MSRRRFRAIPAPPRATGFAIGITMQAAGGIARRPQAEGEATPSAITGPFAATNSTPYTFGEPCGWLVYMLGIGPDDECVWSMTWDDMESTPGVVFFMLEDEAFSTAPMAAQVVSATTSSVANINVYCTVNGEIFGPVTFECLA